MQKRCIFEALSGPEIQWKCHKDTAHRRKYFSKETCFTRDIRKFRFKKKICPKVPRFLDLENIIYIFAYRFTSFGINAKLPFFNIFMYLYNKNILEYAQIAQNVPKSVIVYWRSL